MKSNGVKETLWSSLIKERQIWRRNISLHRLTFTWSNCCTLMCEACSFKEVGPGSYAKKDSRSGWVVLLKNVEYRLMHTVSNEEDLRRMGSRLLKQIISSRISGLNTRVFWVTFWLVLWKEITVVVGLIRCT